MQMRKALIIAAAALALLGISREAGAQRLAVKTNAFGWLSANPDMGLELVTGEKTSVSLSVAGHPGRWTPGYGLFVLRPEFRYWFNGRPLTREYVGVGAFATSYDIAIPERQGQANVFRGDGLALGLTGGYVFSLGKRLSFELGGGTGLLLFRQKQYFDTDSYEAYFVEERSKSNTWGYKLFPVKLDATLIYIIR